MKIDSLYQKMLLIDRYSDYIPVLGSLTNGVDLIQKNFFSKPKGCSPDKERYYERIYTKQNARSLILLLLPVLGNGYFAIHDFYKARRETQPTSSLEIGNKNDPLDSFSEFPFEEIGLEDLPNCVLNPGLLDSDFLASSLVKSGGKIEKKQLLGEWLFLDLPENHPLDTLLKILVPRGSCVETLFGKGEGTFYFPQKREGTLAIGDIDLSFFFKKLLGNLLDDSVDSIVCAIPSVLHLFLRQEDPPATDNKKKEKDLSLDFSSSPILVADRACLKKIDWKEAKKNFQISIEYRANSSDTRIQRGAVETLNKWAGKITLSKERVIELLSLIRWNSQLVLK